MTRILIPLILLFAAIGLFVVYTDPTYQAAKALSPELDSYNKALAQAQELRKTRDTLLSKRNTFSNDDVNKLAHVLPDNIDTIRLIIDINNIASRHSLALGGLQIGSISDSSSAQSAAAVGSSGDPVGSVQMGFTVTTDYNTFLAFLQDLEHSLRIIDVDKLSFGAAASTSGANGISSYSIDIRTYWLH